MAEYPRKLLPWQVTALFKLLVRVAMWAQPLAILMDGDIAKAQFAAQGFGAMDGFVRWRTFQNVRRLAAEPDGLTISAGVSQQRIAWADVLAIETWRQVSRCDFVAIHYRVGGELRVASCGERDGREALRAFLKACGHGMGNEPVRSTMTVAGLQERGIWLPLLRRFAVDVAVPASAAAVFGLFRQALPLAVLTASISAVVAAFGFSLRTARYVLKDGLWCRETSRGPQRLRTIPPRLRLWVDVLAEDAWRR